MIPLRDDNPTRHFAWMTLAIILVNVVAFLLWEPTFGNESQQTTFFYCHAMIPYEVIHHTSLAEGGPAAARALDSAGFVDASNNPVPGTEVQRFLAQKCGHKNWLLSVFTAMFLHGGWLHIGGNMLFLWVFGNNVEDKLRAIPYLIFYLASGVIASIVQVALMHGGSNAVIPNLGASGAIAGVLGAYLLMFPRRRVLTLVIFFLITVVYIPAFVVLGLWFVLQFFNGVASLTHSVNTGGGVAVWAHVGGFAFGALIAWLFLPKEKFGVRPPPRRPDFFGRRRFGLWGHRMERGLPPGGYAPPPPREAPGEGWTPPRPDEGRP